VNAFGYPIGQSTPHIYLSALPFLPSGSIALRSVYDAFPNTLSVEAGRPEQWPAVCQTLVGHSDLVTSVAYSTDGTRVVSGSSDQTVRMWDAASGAPIGEPIYGHSRAVCSVALSPDGTRLVSGSDDETIRIWDAITGAPVSDPLQGHSGGINSVAFSPNGTHIVSGSYDCTIRIWDAAGGTQIDIPLKGHTGSVQSVAFSADGHTHRIRLRRRDNSNMGRRIGRSNRRAAARTLRWSEISCNLF
jgi:WD40 repeat protein